MVDRELPHEPSNAQLLAILSYSLLSQRAGSLVEHRLGGAVTLPGEDHDMGVVDQAVNESCGERLSPKTVFHWLNSRLEVMMRLFLS